MKKFARLTATACPLIVPNLDTDQILPARYLKWPRSRGLGAALFRDLRVDADGKERPEFPLNQARYRDARILLAGRNFGGGSSREAAVYAVYDSGIRCVIAPSFGDIFAQNAVKNGLLTATVPEEEIARLAATATNDPARIFTVDLERKTIVSGKLRCSFAIEPISRNQLLNGWDDIDLTVSRLAEITAFKVRDKRQRPWATLEPKRP